MFSSSLLCYWDKFIGRFRAGRQIADLLGSEETNLHSQAAHHRSYADKLDYGALIKTKLSPASTVRINRTSHRREQVHSDGI